MSRTADHAPWVIALAMWQWSRQQKSDPHKQLDEAISGMVEADREILGDPALRAVMIANASEMYRQGTGGVYDEALCLERPFGFPIDGVTVHDITTDAPFKPLRYLMSLRRVKKILRTIRPEILHTPFLTGYGYWGHFSGFQPNLLTVWGDDVYVTEATVTMVAVDDRGRPVPVGS